MSALSIDAQCFEQDKARRLKPSTLARLTPALIRDVIDRTLEICLVEHTDDFITTPLDSLFDRPYFKPAFDRACEERGFPTMRDNYMGGAP